MRRGFLLSGRVWDMGGIWQLRGECKGLWLLKLLSIGFRDGVRCSRSLLHRLPPPTHLCSSLGADRTEQGSILMVEDGDDEVGLVQSDGVVTVGKVVAPLVRGVLLGEGME